MYYIYKYIHILYNGVKIKNSNPSTKSIKIYSFL